MIQLWKSLYPTDHQNSILPPLPPGAVLLSDEIIERDNPPSRMFSTISAPYLPKQPTRSTKRQSLQHRTKPAWMRPRLEEISWGMEGGRDENPNNEFYEYVRTNRMKLKEPSVSQDYSMESARSRIHRPSRHLLRHMSQDTKSARSGSSIQNNRSGRESLFNDMKSLKQLENGGSMEETHFSYQYSPVRRNRTVSESILGRSHPENLPIQLKDHALRDRTRPLSRRRAIRITDNLLCVPGVERIVEKRFYVKKNTSGNTKKTSIGSTNNSLLGIEETNKGMSKLLDEMRDIKADIEILQRRHAELLDETRMLKPRSPSVSRDDAIVQTDLDTDSSRINISKTNFVQNRGSTRYPSSSSESSDETIKNIQPHKTNQSTNVIVPTLQRKDVPFNFEASRANAGMSTSDEMEKYDKMQEEGSAVENGQDFLVSSKDSNWTSYENLSYVRKEINQDNANVNSGSKNIRVFKITPSASMENTGIPAQLRSEEFVINEAPTFAHPESKMDVAVDPLHTNYNTWSDQLQQQSHYKTTRNFSTAVNASDQNEINMRNYANVIREAYGISAAGGHSAIKPLPTTTMSYASEDDTLIENLNMSNPADVFSLMEPSLSYHDNSFHQQKQYRPQQQYGNSLISATVPRNNNNAQSTFEDLVHQYNAVNSVMQQNQQTMPAYSNNAGASMQPEMFLTSGHLQNYENFIC